MGYCVSFLGVTCFQIGKMPIETHQTGTIEALFQSNMMTRITWYSYPSSKDCCIHWAMLLTVPINYHVEDIKNFIILYLVFSKKYFLVHAQNS